MITLEDIAHQAESDWQDAAACRSSDPGMFFPDREDVESIVRAKAVCASCPVREECLAYAVELNQSEGIWGGHTPAERRRLRRNWLRRLRRAS